MGVKLLIRSLQPKGVAGPTHYELLKRLIDELCASQLAGREIWSVTCQLMKQGHGLVGTVGGPAAGSSGGLKDMWAVSFRDAPEVVFLLQRPEHKVLECEAAVMRLLEKKLEYAKQMTVRFEGHTFSKGDFLIRLCTATQAIHSTQSLLGHCLELEYLPVSSMASSEGMLSEFVDLLRQVLAVVDGRHGGTAAAGGSSLQLEVVKPPYDRYGLVNMPYGRAHAAVAYTDLVMTMLSTVGAAAVVAAQQLQQQQQQQQQATPPPTTQQQVANNQQGSGLGF